ncbi:MAG: hypothetical protein FJ271_04770 [Planctomycetes bacterium]|nr:hypothetical protein [Planctomycetota bacterium]
MDIFDTVAALAAIVHVLAGAAWFGAMFYSLTVLQPRAARYFASPAEYETFVATISQGARWSVLAAFGLVGLSGLTLGLLHDSDAVSIRWLVLVGLKLILFAVAFALFVHVSWRLWPERIMALADEIPRVQRVARRLATITLCLVGLSMALGVLAHR